MGFMQSRPVDNNGLSTRENARLRRERRTEGTREARQRVQNVQAYMAGNQEVAVYNPRGHMLAQQIAQRFDYQLQRDGKPFVKADLIALKLRMLVLQGQDIETHLPAMPGKTCEDLRAELRVEMYASPETLVALRRVATPGPDVRGTGYAPYYGAGGKGEEDVPMASKAP